MFQDTRARQSQDEQSNQEQKKAQDATGEMQRRMQSEALTRTSEVDRQNIEGKTREVQASERVGASSAQVAARTEEMVMGSLEFDLSRNSMPSLLDDNRSKVIHDVRRAILERASAVIAEREEREKSDAAAGQKPE
jgi:hypothetical protein